MIMSVVQTTVEQMAAGVGCVWLLLWVLMTYSELDTDRESPVRMGLWLSVAILGVWLVISIAVVALGMVAVSFLG